MKKEINGVSIRDDIRKISSILFVIGLMFVFEGCKYESITNIYTSDIKAVRDDKKPIFAESKVKMEIPLREDFEKNKTQIKSLLSRHFEKVENLTCEDKGWETYAVAKVQIPIWLKSTGKPSAKGFLSFKVIDLREKEKITGVTLSVDKDKFDLFKKDVESEFSEVSITPKDIQVSIRLYNDERKPISVNIFGSYINGEAEPFVRKMTLRKRQSVELTISTISIIHTFEKGDTGFLYLL